MTFVIIGRYQVQLKSKFFISIDPLIFQVGIKTLVNQSFGLKRMAKSGSNCSHAKTGFDLLHSCKKMAVWEQVGIVWVFISSISYVYKQS